MGGAATGWLPLGVEVTGTDWWWLLLGFDKDVEIWIPNF